MIPARAALVADSPIAAPWPDIWIAAGRATLPLSVRMRRWSGGATFVVQTQHPHTSPARFDLVAPPRHDGLEGENVVPIIGSPSRVERGQFAAALARFADRLEGLPHPRVALIVGGKSGAFDLPPARAASMAEEVAQAVERAGGSLLTSFTRRTPYAARELMRARLSGIPGWVWDDKGDNPYVAFLAAADHILVTEESVNLAVDAASTGRPVHILPMDRAGSHADGKFRKFHEDLRAQGITRLFSGDLESWSYEPLAEADRAATVLLRRYDSR